MKRRGGRGPIIAVLLLGLLIFGGVFFAWTTVSDVFQPVNANANNKIEFQVQPGETGSDIADRLQASHLIRNSLAFRIWVKIKGVDTTKFQAGVYKLSPSMTIDQIISLLLQGQPDEIPVTILEGWRLEQIGYQFAHIPSQYHPLVNFKLSDFMSIVKNPASLANKYPFLKSIPAGNSMEGFLFPDTYNIPVDATAQGVVDIMLDNFACKLQPSNAACQSQQTLPPPSKPVCPPPPQSPPPQKYSLDTLNTLLKQNKLTLFYQTVMLASIVQREARFGPDSPCVASVYWNRINHPTNPDTVDFLDADPTVQYARDSQSGTTKYWTPLNDSARNILPNSPYNTYTHQGFPPSPICSPGLASLYWAANPATTNFYFFLSKPDGHNVYDQTAAEFQADEQKYLGQ